MVYILAAVCHGTYAQSVSQDRIFVLEDGVGARLTNLPDDARFVLLVGEIMSAPEPDDVAPVQRSVRTRDTIESQMRAYQSLIERAADTYRLPLSLVHAVIATESRYDPGAVSPKGAVGLMQLIPGTARRFGVTDRLDPGQSIDGGARYLRHLLDMFDGDTVLALAAYNAGEGAVIKAGRRIPPYRETQGYVTAVLAWQKRISAALRL